METIVAKYHPAIFSNENVQDTLEGTKTSMLKAMKKTDEKTPPYNVGDILWIMEKCALTYGADVPTTWHYRADKKQSGGYKWRKPEEMPKQAARIFLEIKKISADYVPGYEHWVIEFEMIEKPKDF